MGIITAEELVIGTDSDVSYLKAWEKLLDPTLLHESLQADFGSGPRIRLDRYMPKGLCSLVLGVRSLSNAKAFLRSLGIEVIEIDSEELRIPADASFGLDIRLVRSTA